MDACADAFPDGKDQWSAFDTASSQQSDETDFCVGAEAHLQRCGSAASVSSSRPTSLKRSLDAAVGGLGSPASSTKKAKGDRQNNAWPPAPAEPPQPQQSETRNNASRSGQQPSALPRRGLVAAVQPLSEDEEGSPCETPLAPRFAAALDSYSGPCDELTEMLSHLYEAESRTRPSTKYLEEQHGPEFQPQHYLDTSMRTTAVSWLVEVGQEYGLHQESVFLAVALLDRYLTATEGVARNDLQLLSVACMLVAAKHEEERHPSVAEFASIADNSFQVTSLLQMERQVLDVLAFRINSPTPYTFWRFFRHINPMQPATASLASYLTELSLLDYEFLHYAPSEVAAAAVLLALGHQELAAAAQGLALPASAAFAPLAARSGYRAAELHECARELCILHARAAAATDADSPFMAVKDKYYRAAEWHAASRVAPVAWLPDALCAVAPAAAGQA